MQTHLHGMLIAMGAPIQYDNAVGRSVAPNEMMVTEETIAMTSLCERIKPA